MHTTHAAPPAVTLSGVVKEFGAVRAVDGVDLAIGAGERVALLGRNGAGKSTVVDMLLGLNTPTSGTVSLFGGSPREAVDDGRVGAMLQDIRPIPRVTVRELVGFVARTHRHPTPVAEALALAGLTEVARRRADRLSGGQTQRVCFALALVGAPGLLVLDEPTAALDVAARRAFWETMRVLTDRGTTVLFSTHHLEEADLNADRVVVIDRGRIVADDTGERIRRSFGTGLVSFTRPAGTDLPEGLGTLPGVVSVEDLGGRVRLRTTDSDETVHALAGLTRVRDLEVATAGLEEAFIGITSDTGTVPASRKADHR
ncbi:ABC transporter ATP-binding protein [Nocardiopsis lambiniae]|uniref:ABC transporter ATP-binding protein n=1 Tax=Nocardiopsis lambiniae TaxID=3075539 RepID=A0ABU2M6A4_9ACTN|nr:ABC transporter ATP-binding protein [Nocardiopsis sp. DSM 44743]MDT0328186.1 ABC transporter ATP-binding protein [Nocardiopsis sp. DSM 44743]